MEGVVSVGSTALGCPCSARAGARIQPIDVDDLVRRHDFHHREQEFHNESFDLGGPEVLTIEEFSEKSPSTLLRGRAQSCALALRAIKADGCVRRNSFTFDAALECWSVVCVCPGWNDNLQPLIRKTASLHERPRYDPAGACSMKAGILRMSRLDRECVVFCRYLIGQEPNEYVKRKYREAHQAASFK